MAKNDTDDFPDYITFGRCFEKYRWYKPLLVMILGLIFYLIFQVILTTVFSAIYGENILTEIIYGGYETIDSSDASMYFSYLMVALLLPSLYLASRIVRDRPFSSYSSSRGGWNWKLYLKCMVIPFVIYVVFYAISLVINPESGSPGEVSLIAMILALILIPFQCIAEEYIFRGFLMQTFGSWFKIPVLAIVLQAIFFAAGHTYDIKGVIAVGISGIAYGLLAWKTGGLEAGSAIHSINNLLNFYIVAFGIGSLSSTISMWDFVSDIILTVATVTALYYIGNRYEWFGEKTSENNLLDGK